ncbi:MAG: TetR-like C-terminal domain-containing protein [Actinomycetota bacterium]
MAQRLYETAGVDGMSFRAIAAEYGCSSTMPYKYFDSKADLIDGLRVRSYEWLRGVLVAEASEADQPVAALQLLAKAYVRAALDRPLMYELLYSDTGAMPETEPALFGAKRAALDVCKRVIAAAADAEEIELRGDPETAAHLFWAGAHGLVSLELGGFLVMGRSIDDLLDPLITTLIQGLKVPS